MGAAAPVGAAAATGGAGVEEAVGGDGGEAGVGGGRGGELVLVEGAQELLCRVGVRADERIGGVDHGRLGHGEKDYLVGGGERRDGPSLTRDETGREDETRRHRHRRTSHKGITPV